MRLTSTHNPIIKHVRSLERAAVRRESGQFLVEGVRLVREAIGTGQRARIVLVDPHSMEASPDGAGLLGRLHDWGEELYEVDLRVLKAASQTEHPAGVLAVLVRPDEPSLVGMANSAFGVILDSVSDPGNAGTVMRTAAAAGATFVAGTVDTVDLFAPKVVRAGMGAHFKLQLYTDHTWDELRHALADTTLVAASAHAECSLYHFSWPERSALVVGSEARGLSEEADSAVDARVRIPMMAGVESLNVAVAAGILIYAARSSILSSES